jgi:hypothetical protein
MGAQLRNLFLRHKAASQERAAVSQQPTANLLCLCSACSNSDVYNEGRIALNKNRLDSLSLSSLIIHNLLQLYVNYEEQKLNFILY